MRTKRKYCPGSQVKTSFIKEYPTHYYAKAKY